MCGHWLVVHNPAVCFTSAQVQAALNGLNKQLKQTEELERVCVCVMGVRRGIREGNGETAMSKYIAHMCEINNYF